MIGRRVAQEIGGDGVPVAQGRNEHISAASTGRAVAIGLDRNPLAGRAGFEVQISRKRRPQHIHGGLVCVGIEGYVDARK